jgi:Fe-S cluster biogenesis protein NfuA
MAERVQETAQKLIDDVLGPLVAADGGKIELVGVVDKRVLVRLTGTCSGCPGRPYTLSRIVEPAAKKWLGDEYRVEAVVD